MSNDLQPHVDALRAGIAAFPDGDARKDQALAHLATVEAIVDDLHNIEAWTEPPTVDSQQAEIDQLREKLAAAEAAAAAPAVPADTVQGA